MKRQSSFTNEMPTLYLVATPIGNLEEMTPRAIDVLSTVDVIAAEDTRNTQKLLSHFDIKTRMVAHHLYNEANSAKGLLELLEAGQSIALVSDAGYPLISDPGETLVETVTKAGFNVVPVSGSSAFINALVASGLPTQPFTFVGFLPVKENDFKNTLDKYKSYRHTLIFYEAPHRIVKTLTKMKEILGDRKICLARELTKVHEEFIRGTISEVLEIAEELKGEMVIVVDGNKGDERPTLSVSDLNKMVENRIQTGMSASEAIKDVAKTTGISKNKIYSSFHKQA